MGTSAGDFWWLGTGCACIPTAKSCPESLKPSDEHFEAVLDQQAAVWPEGSDRPNASLGSGWNHEGEVIISTITTLTDHIACYYGV